MITLTEAALRHAAQFPLDPGCDRTPLTAEHLPQRLVVILSNGSALGRHALRAFTKLSGAKVLAPIPRALLVPLKDKRITFDDWLGAALEAKGHPKAAIVLLDADTLALVHRHAQINRCPHLRALMSRACILLLGWSDKPLGWAHEQVIALGKSVAFFSHGDAQMSLNAYREQLRQEQMLQRLSRSSVLFKRATVTKVFVETSTLGDLATICATAGLKMDRESTEPLFPRVNDKRAVGVASLINDAINEALHESETAASPGSALLRIARAQERAERYRDALATYQEALSVAPQDLPVRATVVTYLELAGRLDEAERTLRAGLAHPSSRTEAARALRDFYRRQRNHTKELAAARFMRLAGHSAAPTALAGAALDTGKPQLALEALKQAAASSETTPWRQRIQTVATLQVELPALRECAESGAAQDLFTLAEALRQTGDAVGAKSAYDAAVAANPTIVSDVVGPGAGPDFLVVGPPRTATTLLRRLLELHSSIGLIAGESQFLANREPIGLHDFAKMAADVRRRQPLVEVVGDKSPQHFALSDESVALTKTLFPHARIIITTRDPIARAWSEIKIFRHARVVEANIAAVLGDGYAPDWLEEIIDNSRYQTHARKWMRHFGADRVLLVQAEDLERDVVRNCKRIYNWLGVPCPPAHQIETLQLNWSNRTFDYSLHPALAALLEQKCGGETYRLSELTTALSDEPPDEPIAASN